MQIINRFSHQRALLRQFIGYTVVTSIVISLMLTAVQTFMYFNEAKGRLGEQLKNIEQNYADVIATSLWDFNEDITQQQLSSIADSLDIAYVKLLTDYNREYIAGDENIHIDKEITIVIQYDNEHLGKLIVYASYAHIYTQLKEQAIQFFLVLMVQSAALLLLCMVFIRYIVIHRIHQISAYIENIKTEHLTHSRNDFNAKNEKTLVHTSPVMRNEFSQLSNVIERFLHALKNDLTTQVSVQSDLLIQNERLENKVFERTESLEQSHQKLQKLQLDYTLAKHKLIESEKIASIGQLVVGITHEVSTPLNLCVISVSSVNEISHMLLMKENAEILSRTELLSSLDTILQHQQSIEKSLHTAVELMNLFKSFTVEQGTDPQVNINVAKHIENVTKTVKTLFKGCHYQFDFNIDNTLEIYTYPSAWSHILTNLLINSYQHGFEKRTEGSISIQLKKEQNDLVFLYSDNGKGIDKKLMNVVFEPFVSAKHGQRNSGLSLNVVYNIVTHQLNGSIDCIAAEQGTKFLIKVPYNH